LPRVLILDPPVTDAESPAITSPVMAQLKALF
jgi:hypothetical protein